MLNTLEILPSDKAVVVVGLPATGKSFLADLITTQYEHYKVYHTDDYIKHGFEGSLYALMKDLIKDKSPLKLIEGIQGYRLLRKGIELRSFYPDLVIMCMADRPTRITRYEDRGKKLNKGFDVILEKIWSDYLQLLHAAPTTIKRPQFVFYDTLTGKFHENESNIL